MRMKSYFAKTVGDAISMARLELGAEAVLVNSRRTAPETKHLGQYEVVFAVFEAAGQTAASGQQLAIAGKQAPLPATNDFSRELAELRQQMFKMHRSILRGRPGGQDGFLPSVELEDLHSKLLSSELDAAIAQDIVESLESLKPEGADWQGPDQAAVRELEKRFAVDPSLGTGGKGVRVAALVGAPGAGKTSTLVKLAVMHGLTARKPVQILSLDTFRVAAAEQLRSYATIVGAGFQIIETVGALAQALEEHQGKGLILIDTPGYGSADLDDAADLARYFSKSPGIDTHLVLSASMKPADLTAVVNRFEIFTPSKLLFTRLDETASFGPIIAEAARTGKPISFLATGQQIPEDLEPAVKSRIADLIIGRSRNPIEAAA